MIEKVNRKIVKSKEVFIPIFHCNDQIWVEEKQPDELNVTQGDQVIKRRQQEI